MLPQPHSERRIPDSSAESRSARPRWSSNQPSFGLGWAFTGACPGPLFALVGSGVTVMIVAIISALAGTWLYGSLRSKIPH